MSMKGKTMMDMLTIIADEAMPSSHPRADDLLLIGEDMAGILGGLLDDLKVIDRAARTGLVKDPGAMIDAFFRLAAQANWIDARLEQYHQVRADLDGEGYALLAKDGTGIPYFGADDYDDNGNDEVSEQ